MDQFRPYWSIIFVLINFLHINVSSDLIYISVLYLYLLILSISICCIHVVFGSIDLICSDRLYHPHWNIQFASKYIIYITIGYITRIVIFVVPKYPICVWIFHRRKYVIWPFMNYFHANRTGASYLFVSIDTNG